MSDVDKFGWLVDIFLEYQEAVDIQREKRGDRQRFKDALESDRRNRTRPSNSASTIDTI